MTRISPVQTGIVLLYIAIGFMMPLPLNSPSLGPIATDTTTVEAVIMVAIMVLMVGWGLLTPENRSQDEPEEIL